MEMEPATQIDELALNYKYKGMAFANVLDAAWHQLYRIGEFFDIFLPDPQGVLVRQVEAWATGHAGAVTVRAVPSSTPGMAFIIVARVA